MPPHLKKQSWSNLLAICRPRIAKPLKMNERLVVWNDRTIEIIETIMLRQKITNLAKKARPIIQITTLQVAMATLTEAITIVDLVTETTIDEIAVVTVIEIATVTADSAKSVKLLLDQMTYCYQLVAC